MRPSISSLMVATAAGCPPASRASTRICAGAHIVSPTPPPPHPTPSAPHPLRTPPPPHPTPSAPRRPHRCKPRRGARRHAQLLQRLHRGAQVRVSDVREPRYCARRLQDLDGKSNQIASNEVKSNQNQPNHANTSHQTKPHQIKAHQIQLYQKQITPHRIPSIQPKPEVITHHEVGLVREAAIQELVTGLSVRPRAACGWGAMRACVRAHSVHAATTNKQLRTSTKMPQITKPSRHTAPPSPSGRSSARESHHTRSHHITSHHITSHQITSHYITSHHTRSHHITSHDMR